MIRVNRDPSIVSSLIFRISKIVNDKFEENPVQKIDVRREFNFSKIIYI